MSRTISAQIPIRNSTSFKKNRSKKSSSSSSRASSLPKHIRNAHKLEKKRRMQVIYSTVESWILSSADPSGSPSFAPILNHEILNEYFDAIRDLIGLMGYHYKKHFLLPTVIYTDRYIKKSGSIDPSELFQLLLTSAIVTIKFWQDWGIDAAIFEEATGITRKEMNARERKFLNTIDFELFLDGQGVEDFKTSFYESS
eukprot:TRINITY_DN13854_c0_g1_i1.p1 TRINITY_DN13854_c0_g1~~TRINITY_DN13854_c0_g1_i1.p1  ORF type:complete len:198 (-),score=60.59 TRINITY_DN13854_c0_g1_i1:195-788(-)